MSSKLTLPIYDLSGKNTGSIELNPVVFGVPSNPTLVHQAVTSFLANRRHVVAHTKDRGEVAGSNKKPWRQKGTGRARAGSLRSPLWRGGGITFGPRNIRNYSVRLNQKMRQAAFKMVLSDKVTQEKLIIVHNLDLDGKTKSWLKALALIPGNDPKALIVSGQINNLAARAIGNIPTQKYTSLEGLTLYDMLRYNVLIMTKDAIDALAIRYSSANVAETNQNEASKPKALKSKSSVVAKV